MKFPPVAAIIIGARRAPQGARGLKCLISDKRNKEDRWVEKLSLQAAMDRLGKREKYIIRLRFFEGKTQMEVAEEIGISQAQVSRLEKNALRAMRQYLRSE